jgi:hypothetical protein
LEKAIFFNALQLPGAATVVLSTLLFYLKPLKMKNAIIRRTRH